MIEVLILSSLLALGVIREFQFHKKAQDWATSPGGQKK
jgi:hypothetical protein